MQFCLVGQIKEKLHDNFQGEKYAYGISENRDVVATQKKTGTGFIISST